MNKDILGSDNTSDYRLLSLAKNLKAKQPKKELNLQARRKIKKAPRYKRNQILIRYSDKEQRQLKRRWMKSRWRAIKFAAKLSQMEIRCNKMAEEHADATGQVYAYKANWGRSMQAN